MEFRVLKYFLTVAREENITKAAEAIHITQPTLSRQLTQLEEELGVQLFVRGTRRITLTNEGILLRRRAEEIVNLADKTEAELLESDKHLAGTICFGCGELSAMQILTDIIAEFHKKYPLVKYDIFTGTADVVKERMDKGLIDVGLMMEPVDMAKFEFIRLSQPENWGIIMRPDDPLTKQDSVRASDLQGKPLIFSSRFKNSADLRSWFGAYWEKIPIVFTSNLPTNAAMLVQKGMGYAIAIAGVKYFWDPKKIAFRPLTPVVGAQADIFWHRQQPLSPSVERFVDFAKCFLSMNRHDD